MSIQHNPEAFNQVVDKLFQFFDANNSGNIDSDELYLASCKIFEQLNHKIPTKQQTDEFLKKMDEDKNGQLDKEEFSKLVKLLLSSFD